MAYARFEKPVIDANNALQSGVWCEVRREGVANNPLEPLFSDRMGDTPLSNPFYTAGSTVAFHSAGGAFQVRLYKTGYDETFRYVPVGLGAENDLQGFVPMGAWDIATTYTIGDVVTHPDGGDLYLFASKVNDNLAQTPNAVGPADSAYWAYIGVAVQGPAGPSGVIGTWRGPWVTLTAYALNDAVEYAGSGYICISSHTAGTFATDLAASKWQLVAAKGADAVVLSRSELKALNTSAVVRALFDGSQWAFRAGNYAARVAADTLEGIYVKATAIAASSGAWVRQYSGKIQVDWFGTGAGNIAGALAVAASGQAVELGASTYTVTASVVVPAGVALTAQPGGTITQGAAANISPLVDMTSATGGALLGVTVDGNRSNNTDNDNHILVYLQNANDVTVAGNTFRNGTGYGVVSGSPITANGTGNKIIDNKFTNFFSAPVLVISQANAVIKAKVERNVLTGPFRKAIYVQNAGNVMVANNTIDGLPVIGTDAAVLKVDISGTAVTWVSGPTFANVSPGQFLVVNGGLEYLVTAKASSTALTIDSSAGSLSNATASIGAGDHISLSSSADSIVTGNTVNGGATLGITLDNVNGGNGTVRCSVTNNLINSTGESGISIQTIANSALVSDILISGNEITNVGQIGASLGSDTFLSAIGIAGTTTNIKRIFVDGNAANDNQGSATTKYWMGLSVTGNGEIHCGENTGLGMVNNGVLGGSSGVTLTGWGTGATATVVTHGSSMRVTVTAGTTPSANPTVTVGTTATAANNTPNYVSKYISGTGALQATYGEQNSDKTAAVFLYNGTPVNGETYVFNVVS